MRDVVELQLSSHVSERPDMMSTSIRKCFIPPRQNRLSSNMAKMFLDHKNSVICSPSTEFNYHGNKRNQTAPRFPRYERLIKKFLRVELGTKCFLRPLNSSRTDGGWLTSTIRTFWWEHVGRGEEGKQLLSGWETYAHKHTRSNGKKSLFDIF